MNAKSNSSADFQPLANRIVRKRLKSLKPSPENDELYRPVDPNDPEIRRLAASIKKLGVKEPLVITADRFILSGHRRYVAAMLVGQVTVPCRVMRYRDISQRYKRSGKSGLVVLVASDFDPEGEEIVQVAGRTLRDDFGIRGVELVKVAITADQIDEFDLPPNLEAKESSSRYTKFVERHGTNVYELEALTPVDADSKS